MTKKELQAFAELAAKVATLEKELGEARAELAIKKGKAKSPWKEPNGLDLDTSLTDSREWRNVSWSGGTPPGPWEEKLREADRLAGKSTKIPYSPYKGGTRGEREVSAKDAYVRVYESGEVAPEKVETYTPKFKF